MAPVDGLEVISGHSHVHQMDNADHDAPDLTADELARMIDHTSLGPGTTIRDIANLCREATCYKFASVCVPPCFVKDAKLMLNGNLSAICTVSGFPHGNSCTGTKAMEAHTAIQEGAVEIDMVMAIGLLKSGSYKAVEKDIEETVRVCEGVVLVKVILECALLTDEEKRTACLLARDAGANFVKTSTGYAGGGATQKDIALMHDTVGNDLGIKASGGIRTAATARAMIRAGATRIGASASLAIMRGV